MELQSLRPTEGADLDQLRSRLEGAGWRAAVPQSLTDPLLLKLARDFRLVEQSTRDDVETPAQLPSLAPALYVVMQVLLRRQPGAKPPKLTITETQMLRALQAYQWRLEREIVSRIIGVASPDDAHAQAQEVWSSVQT